MKRIMTLLISLFAGIVISATGYGESVRIIAVDEPPSSYVDDLGMPSGFSVDVVKEIQRRVGNIDKIIIAPEPRALKAAQESPNVVIFGFSRTQEREDQFHWITPLIRKSWVLYGRKDSEHVLGGLEDARRLKNIGVVRGDVREKYLGSLNFSNIEKVSHHELSVKMLLNRRIDALYYEPLGMAYACRKLGIPLSEFKVLLNTRVSEVYVLMSKTGTSPELVETWTNAANAMHDDGTFQRIAEKWSDIIFQQIGTTSDVVDRALNF